MLKTCHFCELLLELRSVVILDSEDGKKSICAGNWIALECSRSYGRHGGYVVGHSTRRRISSASRTPSTASPMGSIPVWGQQSRNWSDSKGEAAKNNTCETEAKGAQRRPSKRALFTYQYSELDDKISSLVNIPTENNLLPIETLSLLEAWRYVALCIIQSV